MQRFFSLLCSLLEVSASSDSSCAFVDKRLETGHTSMSVKNKTQRQDPRKTHVVQQRSEKEYGDGRAAVGREYL